MERLRELENLLLVYQWQLGHKKYANPSCLACIDIDWSMRWA